MRLNISTHMLLKQARIYSSVNKTLQKCYHNIPFLDLYHKTTGHLLSQKTLDRLKTKHPHIDTLTHDRLQCTLQILGNFGITAQDACINIHLFSMNPITVDNYGKILRECNFLNLLPKYIIRYHTLVRLRTISQLKREGLLSHDLNLEKVLQDHLPEWPSRYKTSQSFSESDTPIITVRMSILEKYLIWRLSITEDEFKKYCRNYLPLKHKPLSDIQEALDIAENEIKFNADVIRRNGFIISSDPINTRLILENVDSLAGIDIGEVIKMEPGILKNNYNALLKIRSLLEEYRIPNDAQRRCLRIYCMNPNTVEERLTDLRNLKEYQVLSTNPRVLWMVVYKNKMMTRISKIQAAKKQCYSLNHLVSSSKVFNNYINSFGDKVCGRDIAVIMSTSLDPNKIGDFNKSAKKSQSELTKILTQKLRRHKYWLHVALNVVDENIQYLKTKFDDKIIFNNCLLLLYPIRVIKNYTNILLEMRDGSTNASQHQLDANYSNVNCQTLTDDQILSLALYEIEKKYHFTGNGIWAKQDGNKVETQIIT